MKLPDLTPTRSLADVADAEFLLRHQKPIDAFGPYPLRQVAMMAIAHATSGITLPDLSTTIEDLQGESPAIQFPRNGSSVQHFTREVLLPNGFCSATKEKIHFRKGATDSVRVEATDLGRDSMPLIGVFSTWQLKHGVDLRFLIGYTDVYSDRPFSGAPTRRLRIFQQLLTEGRTSVESARKYIPLGISTLQFALSSMRDGGLLDAYNRSNPQHRQIEIVGSKLSDPKKGRDEVTNWLAVACGNLLEQERQSLTAHDLIVEALQIAPHLSKEDFWKKLVKGPLSFFKYCDERIFGPPGQKPVSNCVFHLRPGFATPIRELLTSIASLDDAKFRRHSEAAAFDILKEPLFVRKLLTLPRDWEQATPFSLAPAALLERVKKLTTERKDHSYETMRKNLERLFELGILVANSEDKDKIAFAEILRTRLSPPALRLFLRASGLELLFYGSVLSEDEIRAQINIGPRTLGDFIKLRILPTVHSLITSNRISSDSW